MKRLISCVVLALLVSTVSVTVAVGQGEFAGLEQDQSIASFKVATIYENEAGDAVGLRLRHVPSNFVLDVLRIQSLPQGFAWVNTAPSSDMGRPHTLEHLVLGKGPKAQWVASYENMSLASSSAGTGQTITGYHFYATAGKESFFEYMEMKLDGLLNPNYSDEEIRREMCNLGYSLDPADSSIQLEEKGSVYTEMVSTFEGADWNHWQKLDEVVYGEDHPLSNSSGGYPPSIRLATAEDLKNFHDSTYRLNNMGMILSVPDEYGLEELLSRVSEIFSRIEPDACAGEDPVTAHERFPEPRMAPFGTIAIAEFPHQNENQPGGLMYAWPAVQRYDWYETVLQTLLINNLARGETSNLYKKIINSQTRVTDIGASGVSGWVSENRGRPIYISFSDIGRDIATEEMIDSVRGLILNELDAIANFADGSDELKEFNERASSRILQLRRQIRSNLNSPPGFGFRGADWWWLEHLSGLSKAPGFRKQLVPNDLFTFAEDLIASGENFWHDYIVKWQLLTNKPYGVAVRANPNIAGEEEKERDVRLAGHLEALKAKYGTEDAAEAKAKFVAEYDEKTAVIDAATADLAMPRFIDNPPLTLDEQLDYRIEKLPGGGDNVVSTFENITSAEICLAMRMDLVPEEQLYLVGALPVMLTEVGVIKDGEPIPYDETRKMMQREILDLNAGFSASHGTHRVELAVTASGSVLEESEKAVSWMETFLFSPDWRVENLPRIRDAIDAGLADARNGMRGWEEYWVDNPSNAYLTQTDPLLMSALSFLTHQHDLLAIRWMLKEAPDEKSYETFVDFIDKLAAFGKTASRIEMAAVTGRLVSNEVSEDAVIESSEVVDAFAAMPEPVRELAKDAAEDLQYSIAGFPDNSLVNDWVYLCTLMKDGLGKPAAEVLSLYEGILQTIRHRDNVRGYLVASSASQKVLLPLQNEIVDRFSADTSARQTYSNAPIVHGRIRGRIGGAEPVHVGLINPGTRNGVFLISAPGVGYTDYDREKFLNYLASRLYGGGGAHSLFMKTWAAGLAYSNGLGSNSYLGRIDYYAERCPSLVQTMQFVIDELKKAEPDESLVDYAVAQAFRANRAGNTYERRGARMAADLADGLGPDVIAGYREALLELKSEPGLLDELKARMLPVCGTIMPGLGPNSADVEGGVYLMIGPEAQFVSFEEYLKSVEGEDVVIYRIYPRDFWIVH